MSSLARNHKLRRRLRLFVVVAALAVAGAALWYMQLTAHGAVTGAPVGVASAVSGYVENQTLGGGADDDAFGWAVAIDGTTAVVGAPRAKVGNANLQGSAFVFVRTGATWTQQQQLFASDGAALDLFGLSVAISGDTVVVGAIKDHPVEAREGAAYVFVRTGTTWTQQQRLAASDGTPSNYFGVSVSIIGNRLAVGASRTDIGPGRPVPEQGAVYLFTRTGATWTPEVKLTADDGSARDDFGRAVSLSGASLAVGAPGDDINANSNQGSVYIFEISGKSWEQRAKLTASDGAAGDVLGVSVALEGATLLAGASGDTTGANHQQGAAYAFASTGSSPNRTWSQQGKLMLNDGASEDALGGSVALSGDIAVLGARTHTVLDHYSQGAVYLFARAGTIWSRQQELLASDGAINNYFGGSVAIDGDTVFSGAHGHSAAYVFKESQQPPVVTVSAANFNSASVASEGIVAAYGAGLATATQVATSFPLPTTLAGTSASVKDSAGVLRGAPLFFVSPVQVNLQIPPGTAAGAATILITSGDGTFSGGALQIQTVAPSLFTANANGQGVPAALVLRVKFNGAQSFEPVAQFDAAQGRFVAVPIDLGPESDQVFLVLYGTGIRFRSALSAVSATVGGPSSEVLFAGASLGFVGLDQVNVRMSHSLAGRGDVEVALSVDSKAANAVRVNIR